MLIFLFFLLLAASIFSLRYLTKNNSAQKRQIMLLLRQNEILRNKVNTLSKVSEIPDIKFVDIEFKTGTVVENSSLWLCPLDSGPIIKALEPGHKFYITSGAYVGNILWYEIYIDNQDNINSKGWIKESSVIIDPPKDDTIPVQV